MWSENAVPISRKELDIWPTFVVLALVLRYWAHSFHHDHSYTCTVADPFRMRMSTHVWQLTCNICLLIHTSFLYIYAYYEYVVQVCRLKRWRPLLCLSLFMHILYLYGVLVECCMKRWQLALVHAYTIWYLYLYLTHSGGSYCVLSKMYVSFLPRTIEVDSTSAM